MTRDAHEKALETAYKTALKAVKAKPTTDSLKALEAAERMLKEHRAQNETDPKKQSLATTTAVLEYLQGEGWKVSQSKLYEDLKKVEKKADGSFLKKAIDEYAKTFLKRLDGSDENLTSLATKRAQLEMEEKEEQLKKIRRANAIAEGRLFARTEVKQKHAQKLARFMTLVENFIHGRHMEEILEGHGCELAKIPDAQDKIEKHFREILADYAMAPKFTIPKKNLIEAEELMADNE